MRGESKRPRLDFVIRPRTSGSGGPRMMRRRSPSTRSEIHAALEALLEEPGRHLAEIFEWLGVPLEHPEVAAIVDRFAFWNGFRMAASRGGGGATPAPGAPTSARRSAPRSGTSSVPSCGTSAMRPRRPRAPVGPLEAWCGSRACAWRVRESGWQGPGRRGVAELRAASPDGGRVKKPAPAPAGSGRGWFRTGRRPASPVPVPPGVRGGTRSKPQAGRRPCRSPPERSRPGLHPESSA